MNSFHSRSAVLDPRSSTNNNVHCYECRTATIRRIGAFPPKQRARSGATTPIYWFSVSGMQVTYLQLLIIVYLRAGLLLYITEDRLVTWPFVHRLCGSFGVYIYLIYKGITIPFFPCCSLYFVKLRIIFKFVPFLHVPFI